MNDSKLSDGENQTREDFNTWLDDLPGKAGKIMKDLEKKMLLMESFDLLSTISYYNHLHSADHYSDDRGDKMFAVSELIALVAMQGPYVEQSTLKADDVMNLSREIQELASRYFGIVTMLQMKENRPVSDFSFEGIAFKSMRDQTIVRNQGIPEHHLMFSKEMYLPLEKEIKKEFGFSVAESIMIREAIVSLINEKVNNAFTSAREKSFRISKEIFQYRATKMAPENSTFSKELLDTLISQSRKQIKIYCDNYCNNSLFFRFSETYCFSVGELATFSGLEILIVDSFVKNFSCEFDSSSGEKLIFGPSHILKTSPLVYHDDKILVPSMPLLTWCVEARIEKYINTNKKLSGRFKKLKHDFLLKKGIEFISKVLNDQVEVFPNLFYYDNEKKGNRFETDVIIKYDKILFIVEAKGHRISQAAKDGMILRTEKHLEEIVKDSYEQGLRTLKYIESKDAVEFSTSNKNLMKISRRDFDEFVVISLVLEPIGSIVPLIRATNELGYFSKDTFPLIISIYDLIVVSDHLEFPILFPHYIKRRREFLSYEIMNIYDELDLLSYYLYNRLYIENIYGEAKEKNATMIYLETATDEINNFYMQKFRFQNSNPPKLTLNLPDIFKKILESLEKIQFTHRQSVMMRLLDISLQSLEKFKIYIEKIKLMFAKDGLEHDCSIMTEIWGKKIGFTFMTGASKIFLDQKLLFFSKYKLDKLDADVWIGFGDTMRTKDQFGLQSCVILTKPEISK